MYDETSKEAEVLRQKKMSGELEELGRACEQAVALSEKLETQLGHVMIEQPRASENQTALTNEQLPKLLEEIRNYRYRVNMANATLKSILSRLEI